MDRILVVEDDADMQFVLSDNLQAEGYEVASTTSGREGAEMALTGRFQLVILDLMLPDLSGVEVCKTIRLRDRAIPVIMLTAKGEEIDKVVGLEVGADDYVTKPFGMREFLARVKAALRRSGGPTQGTPGEHLIGDLRIDLARHEVAGGDRRERLTRYEAELLQLLLDNRGEVLSREKILENIWGQAPDSSNRTVDNYVARLRAKVEEAPAKPRHIITVHGKGYKLV